MGDRAINVERRGTRETRTLDLLWGVDQRQVKCGRNEDVLWVEW